MSKCLKNIGLLVAIALCLGIFIPVANEACSAISIKTIKVGWFEQPSYQETLSDGSKYGYGYEYYWSISQYNNWAYEFVDGTISECNERLKKGEVDVVGCLNYSEERASEFDITSIPQGSTYSTLFSSLDSELSSSDYSTFFGITIGICSEQERTDLTDFLEANDINAVTIQSYPTYNELLTALKNDDIDACSASGVQTTNKYKLLATFAPTDFYFFVTKGNDEVLNGFNNALNRLFLENPSFNEDLYEKYFSVDSSSLSFTESEKAFIKHANVLSVTYSDDWAPIEYSASGSYAGMGADFFKRISELSGLKFEFIPGDKKEANSDLVALMERDFNSASAMGYHLSLPLVSFPLAIVTHEDSRDKNGITAYSDQLLNTSKLASLGYDLLNFSNASDCFEALKNGEVGSVICNAYTANNLKQELSYRNFSVNILPDLKFELSVGVRYDLDSDLISIINKCITAISEAETNEIIIQNSVKTQSGFVEFFNKVPSFIIAIVAILLLLLVCSLIFLSLALFKRNERIQLILGFDNITGIFNRYGYENYVKRKLSHNPPEGKKYYLVAFDLSDFGLYNEINGISAGNDLLVLIAKQLKKNHSSLLAFCRYNADNFSFFTAAENIDRMKSRIEDLNKQLLLALNGEITLISYGIYEINDSKLPPSLMYDRALSALQTLNDNYQNYIAVCDEVLFAKRIFEANLITEQEYAIKNNEFIIYYQPKYDTSSETIVGAEALVRWKKPDGTMISPLQFIELFEKNGQIIKLDFYIFETVCRHLRERSDCGIPNVPISINFSRAHLFSSNFTDNLMEITNRYGISPELLEIELTESTFKVDIEKINLVVNSLHSFGFKVSVDDFGSEYSSLNILKDINADTIKIDMRFMTNFEKGGKVGTIVSSVVRMTKWLNIPVVAEGIETREQVEFLRSIGCDMIQGYYFAKPMPKLEFNAHLQMSPKLNIKPTSDKSISQDDINMLMGGNLVVSKLLESLCGGFGLYEFNETSLELLRANNGYYRIFHSTISEVNSYAKNVFDMVAEADRESFIDTIKKAIASKEERSFLITRKTPKGDISISGKAILLGKNNNLPLICLTFID